MPKQEVGAFLKKTTLTKTEESDLELEEPEREDFSSHSEPYDTSTRPTEPLDGIKQHPATECANRVWGMTDPFKYAPANTGSHWKHICKLSQNYDEELCETWRDEVDKLLIFAGLFSATVTSFLTESYKTLQPDQSTPSAHALMEILNRLVANDTGNFQSTLPSQALTTSFSPQVLDILINIFWFLSLNLSLATVLIGIICMQWLREFRKYGELSYHDTVEVRRIRYEGILHWRVPSIFSILPVMLQAALFLFFFGLACFLWKINTVVAIPVVIGIGIVLLFVTFTTIAPALQYCYSVEPTPRNRQCPYKSPQSWLFLEITLFLINVLRHLRPLRQASNDNLGINDSRRPSQVSPNLEPPLDLSVKTKSDFFSYVYGEGRRMAKYGAANWLRYDLFWKTRRNEHGFCDKSQELLWAHTVFGQNPDTVDAIYLCLQDLPPTIVANIAVESNPSLAVAVQSFLADSLNHARLDPQIVETISGLFLRGSLPHHPHLQSHVCELYIRHVNHADHVQKLLRYSLPVLPDPGSLELNMQMSMSGERAMWLNTLPEKYVVYHLYSMKNLLQLLPFGGEKVKERHIILNQLSSALATCEQWIKSGRDGTRAKETLIGLAYCSEEYAAFTLSTSHYPDGKVTIVQLRNLVHVVRDHILEYGVRVEEFSRWQLKQWVNLRYSLGYDHQPYETTEL